MQYRDVNAVLIDADHPPAHLAVELVDHRLFHLGENSRRMLEHGVARAKEALEAAGAKLVLSEAPMRVAGWHLMGTARMGDDPSRSVVNGWGRSHDVKNLFIIDGSLFVTAAAVNPTNTIQALALHVADRIKRNLANLFD